MIIQCAPVWFAAFIGLLFSHRPAPTGIAGRDDGGRQEGNTQHAGTAKPEHREHQPVERPDVDADARSGQGDLDGQHHRPGRDRRQVITRRLQQA